MTIHRCTGNLKSFVNSGQLSEKYRVPVIVQMVVPFLQRNNEQQAG